MKNIVLLQVAASLLLVSGAIGADSPAAAGPGSPQSAIRGPEPAAGIEATVGAFPAGPGGRNTSITPPARPDPLPPFYDPKLTPQKRVDDLVSRLTLEEKVAMMQMASPAIPRLGIAPYHWWTEALHGMTHDTETVFPQAIGLAATWDTNLHYQVATTISTEAARRTGNTAPRMFLIR